jgi:hypothetical protein
MYISNIGSAGCNGRARLQRAILHVGVTMRNDVWVPQQIDQIVKNESRELHDVTVTVLLHSLGTNRKSANGRMAVTA